MMTPSGFLLVSIVIGSVLIYLPFLVVGYARFQVGYDTSAPRAVFDKLPPYAKRATWAHQNSFEAFTLFAPAALMAYVTGQSSQVAVGAAIVYLIGRTLYSVFYILDVPLLRSLMFGLGSLGTFTLFVVSCRSVLM
ncbi:MAPEG family protein [Pseudanabaena sp. FACHB-2040]|uniref:MAPEG family protein n=1 Tax=Pseudanabaena sp. FACHB-2040 TaxID=2692859 RepID=UPI0016836064|nr:MAPEG family protein [Pseudanabaena sp. FACHB-2040]MBD2260071.1 MAPEG family protein [Pseudanabaena sp. FACHB-2040]